MCICVLVISSRAAAGGRQKACSLEMRKSFLGSQQSHKTLGDRRYLNCEANEVVTALRASVL